MDRPKHRRTLLVALVLLAGGALLSLGRQWTSQSEHSIVPTELPRGQPAHLPSKRESPRVEVAASSAPALPPTTTPEPATGFRGRVIDAVTRQPLPEFE